MWETRAFFNGSFFVKMQQKHSYITSFPAKLDSGRNTTCSKIWQRNWLFLKFDGQNGTDFKVYNHLDCLLQNVMGSFSEKRLHLHEIVFYTRKVHPKPN